MATYTGNMGGRDGAHAACAAEFPGGHLCHASEYLQAGSAVSPPATGAWIDPSTDETGSLVFVASTKFGRGTSTTCTSWTSAVNNAWTVTPAGAFGSGPCSVALPLACCDGLPRVELVGFSASEYTGNVGGRSHAHAICDGAWPGSHMCHIAEYLRAASSMPVPASGAWIDASADPTGQLIFVGVPSAGRHTSTSCTNFTSIANNSWIVGPEGAASSAPCANPHRFACCRVR